MDRRSLFGDCGVESSLPVSDVVDNADAAVGLNKAVLPFDHVTISLLPGSFDVTSMRVVDTVLIGVERVVFL